MWNTNESDIGAIGSESGIIIIDLEYSEGARISLEKDTKPAPFTITLGIYGLIMHTIMCDSESEAIEIISSLRDLTEEAIRFHQSGNRDKAYLVIDKIVEL